MRKDFLVFGQPMIEEEEINEVVDSLKTSWIGTGPKVAKFESDFKLYKNIKYAAAVNSCTAALHLACLGLDLQPGDEVITTAMTFCATVNSVIHSGATPVLADIDPVTLNIDADDIERKISPKTKAIIIVHFGGLMCDMDRICKLAEGNDIYLIEDCAHAIESEYKQKKAGCFGHVGCFSFYATKNLVTGEGGMLISSDEDLISKIKILSLHGLSADAWSRFSDSGYKHYYVERAGYKYNMMDLQAAIGIHQLKRIEKSWFRRKKIWNKYMDAFTDLPVGLPAVPDPDVKHGYHLFTLRIDSDKTGISRDEFLNRMQEKNIGCGVHYVSIPEHPYYQKEFSWSMEDYPHAVRYGRETVSIPLSPKLTDMDVNDVVEAVRQCINRK